MVFAPEHELVPYPPPPWQLSGNSWLGLFRADTSLTLPVEYKHILSARYVAVALIRYLSGTLQYDELIVASLVRRRARVGLYVHHIWVDDLSSLWGGRKIWGLQKEMAVFAWEKNVATVSDAEGLIAQIEVNQDKAQLPTLPLWMPSFGNVDGQAVFTVGRINARLGRARMRVQDWSPRFGFRLAPQPFLSVAGKPFAMVFTPPTVL
jgi:Acetoacetate decarboxylase (ADC)